MSEIENEPRTLLDGAASRPREKKKVQPGGGGPAGSSLVPSVGTRYFFSFSAELDTTSVPPTQVAGGTRVHVNYKNGAVITDPTLYRHSWGTAPAAATGDVSQALRERIELELGEKPEARVSIMDLLKRARQEGQAALDAGKKGSSQPDSRFFWPGMAGKILSGRDTVLVREDGVAVYDSRFAISADGFVIDARAAGTIDFMRALATAKDGPDAYDQYRTNRGHPHGSRLEMKMWFRFEPACDPGEAARYAAPRYVLQSLGAWKYEPLARGQFIGIGSITVDKARNWPARTLQMDVFEVCP